MVIEHIVISGGGPTGLLSYGALKYLEQKHFWDIENIKSIYGTSIGSLIATIISLKHDWKTIDDYLIKCPWDKILPVDTTIDNLFNAYENKGIIPHSIIEIFMKPLLLSKDLSLDITLEDYYKFNNIEIHFMSVELNDFTIENISYITYPKLKLVDALKMSCVLPIMFTPFMINDKCYIDGGLLLNYPLDLCIQDQECDPDNVMGLKNIWEGQNEKITHASNLFNYIKIILRKIGTKMDKENNKIKIKNEINCINELKEYVDWLGVLNNEDCRSFLIERGMTYGEIFITYITKLKNNNSNNINSNNE